jgi:hypothetical protein
MRKEKELMTLLRALVDLLAEEADRSFCPALRSAAR